MKHCNTCDKTKEDSEFHKRKASKDGLAARCKDCQKEYDSARLKDPKRMKMRRDYQRTDKGKKAHAKATKKWIEKNTIKRAVHIITGNAIRDGMLTKKDCEKCGCSSQIQAHHMDYAKPLDVTWLCVTCHAEWHRLNGEGKNSH